MTTPYNSRDYLQRRLSEVLRECVQLHIIVIVLTAILVIGGGYALNVIDRQKAALAACEAGGE